MQIFISVVILVILIVVAVFLITGLTGAPYVPTLGKDFAKVVDEIYPLSKKDLLIDLGAGDGIILDIASQKGAKALGIELNPFLYALIRHKFRKNPKVSVRLKNFYHFSFPKETTVVYAFAVGVHIEPMYRKIRAEAKRLGKPIYFISNAFDLRDLKPEKRIETWYLYKILP